MQRNSKETERFKHELLSKGLKKQTHERIDKYKHESLNPLSEKRVFMTSSCAHMISGLQMTNHNADNLYRYNLESLLRSDQRISRLASSIACVKKRKSRQNILIPTKSDLISKVNNKRLKSDSAIKDSQLAFQDIMQNPDQLLQEQKRNKVIAAFKRRCEVNASKFIKFIHWREHILKNQKVQCEENPVLDKVILDMPIADIFRNAMYNDSVSVDLISKLETLDEQDFESLVQEISASVDVYIENVNTCFVIKSLCRRHERVALLCCGYIFNHLQACLALTHTSRLVYTLCSHCQVFRDKLLKELNRDLLSMISSMQGAILVSMLIENIPSVDQCVRFYIELKNDSNLLRDPFFCRALSTFMEKCSDSLLTKIAALIEAQINYLLSDDFGKYLLKIFFDRKSSVGICMCERALIGLGNEAFTCENRRYVLYKALMYEYSCNFAERIIGKVAFSAYSLDQIVPCKVANLMLLLALSRTSPSTAQYFAVKIRKYCKDPSFTRKINCNSRPIGSFMKKVKMIEYNFNV